MNTAGPEPHRQMQGAALTGLGWEGVGRSGGNEGGGESHKQVLASVSSLSSSSLSSSLQLYSKPGSWEAEFLSFSMLAILRVSCLCINSRISSSVSSKQPDGVLHCI